MCFLVNEWLISEKQSQEVLLDAAAMGGGGREEAGGGGLKLINTS